MQRTRGAPILTTLLTLETLWMDSVMTLTMNPTLDIGLSVEGLVPGKKLRSETVRREPGGGGINVARGINRLGGRVCALFPGDDVIGARLEGLLEERSVPHRRLPVRGTVREGISVWVRDEEALFHFVMPGPEFSRDEAQRALDAVLDHEPCPDWLVASGSLPPGVDDGFYARLARAARERDIRFVLDSHGAPLRAALAERSFLVKCNRREFAALVGADEPTGAEVRELARALAAESDVQALVITLGADGALLTTRDDQVRFRPPRVEPRSPVGAGDSFVAACVYELAGGGSLRAAVHSGVAGAAAAVRTPGTELFELEDYRRIRERTEECSDECTDIEGEDA